MIILDVHNGVASDGRPFLLEIARIAIHAGAVY